MGESKAAFVDGTYNLLRFRLAISHLSQAMEFAVRFHCSGQQFWGNNSGCNYKFLRTAAKTENC
jgi:hypothetical protein